MKRKNIFNKYLLRKDFFWKVKEKIFWFIRNNSRNAFRDQRCLLNNKDNGIILDVGAHIGDTVRLYQNYFPGYKIFCFEPYLESYVFLKNRFGSDHSINPVNKALSVKDDSKRLYLSNFENLNSLKKPKNNSWGFEDNKFVDVETTSLDRFSSLNDIKHIDILKLDVQGSELDVLKGSKMILEKSKISLIYVEWQVVPLYEYHHKYFKIAEFLEKYDYELFNLYNTNEARSGQLRWCDAIYTSKGIRNSMISKFGLREGSGW